MSLKSISDSGNYESTFKGGVSSVKVREKA